MEVGDGTGVDEWGGRGAFQKYPTSRNRLGARYSVAESGCVQLEFAIQDFMGNSLHLLRKRACKNREFFRLCMDYLPGCHLLGDNEPLTSAPCWYVPILSLSPLQTLRKLGIPRLSESEEAISLQSRMMKWVRAPITCRLELQPSHIGFQFHSNIRSEFNGSTV